MSEIRPYYWSVRRELWENRSLYIAPLVVAVLSFIGFMLSTVGMPHRRRGALLLEPHARRKVIEAPYDVIAMMLIVTMIVIAIFYCLDALYGERRDRSILFWKSLPVADRISVLAKATIPFAILPALTFVIVVVTQFLMLLWTSLVLMPSGLAGTTWSIVPIVQLGVVLFYGLVVLVLWHAPIYGWLLLVSSWARRATFLYAILPLLIISFFEKIAFNTHYFALLMQYRLMGHMARAFDFAPDGRLDTLGQLTPGRFLATPGLWIGLIVAALFLVGAVKLRRDRGPI